MPMSEYMLKSVLTASQAVLQAKEKRKQVLAEVWSRRRIIYSRHQKKLQSHKQEIQSSYT